jgi:hypothetical protein
MSPGCFRLVFASRIARLLGVATLGIVAFAATPSAGRSPASRLDALPRAGERLAQPIWLPHCHMRIVEWRTTAALPAETTPNDDAIAVIDETCREVFGRYEEFLRAQHLPRPRGLPQSLPAMSLLPGNTLLDGKSQRALNDLPSRFEAVAPGCCYWGLYVDSLNHLFLRNDPLILDDGDKLVKNPRFVRTFTHELSHVLSARLGVWDAVGYDRRRDEDLAEDFVAYMGMHFPAESSADDLAFHRGHAAHPSSAEAEPATVADRHAHGDSPGNASANMSPQR